MHNLAAKGNEQKAAKAEAQKQATLWLYRIKNRQMSKHQVRFELDNIADKNHQELVRQCLNDYSKK